LEICFKILKKIKPFIKLAVGLVIQINTNGGFEVWSVNRGNQQSKRLFFKTGQIKTANTEAESSDGAIVVVNDSSIENKS